MKRVVKNFDGLLWALSLFVYCFTIIRHLFLFQPKVNNIELSKVRESTIMFLRTKHQSDNNLTHVEHTAHNNQMFTMPFEILFALCHVNWCNTTAVRSRFGWLMFSIKSSNWNTTDKYKRYREWDTTVWRMYIDNGGSNAKQSNVSNQNLKITFDIFVMWLSCSCSVKTSDFIMIHMISDFGRFFFFWFFLTLNPCTHETCCSIENCLAPCIMKYFDVQHFNVSLAFFKCIRCAQVNSQQ